MLQNDHLRRYLPDAYSAGAGYWAATVVNTFSKCNYEKMMLSALAHSRNHLESHKSSLQTKSIGNAVNPRLFDAYQRTSAEQEQYFGASSMQFVNKKVIDTHNKNSLSKAKREMANLTENSSPEMRISLLKRCFPQS